MLALLYYGAAELSRGLASTPQNVTPVWPPDGFAVAVVFLQGYALLPGVFLGSFLSNIWAFWDSSSWSVMTFSVLGVMGIALGTTLGTGAGIFALKKATRSRYPLQRVSDVIKFLLFSGLLGPMVNAAVGVAMLCSLSVVPWPLYKGVWLTWWISNVAGIFIVTPAVMSWVHWLRFNSAEKDAQQTLAKNITKNTQILKLLKNPLGNLSKRDKQQNFSLCEALLIVGLMAAVGRAAFWQSYSLDYVLIPLLIWSTFRFGHRGATLAVVGISAMAIAGTVRGLGSFASDDMNNSLVSLQSFIAVTVFTALMLSAVLAERSLAEERLRIAISDLATVNQELEHRVADRTQALDRKNQSLNSTLQELHQVQAQMIQSEKMSSIGQMVAGIAHEINNPVNFIHGNIIHLGGYITDTIEVVKSYQTHYPQPLPALQTQLEALELDFVEKDAQKLLNSMRLGTQRIREIVISLRNFSRLDESTLKLVDIHEGLESTLLLVKHRLLQPDGRPSIHVVRDYGDLPLVECFSSSLNQVVMNILNNAIDAMVPSTEEMPEGALPTITLRTDVMGDWVTIAIADNGPGIPDAINSKVFDPFFTTKPVGKGTGMGLSVAYQIITQEHGGKLTFDTAATSGTEFTIQIPLKQT